MPAPWPLSAPESLVLRDGAAGQEVAALKLAVLELVGRRVLRVESERRRFGRRTWVAPGGSAPPATGPLAGLARTCLEQTAEGRRPLDKAVTRHLRAHGRSPERWLADEVLASLEARGLMVRESRRALGILTRESWSRTQAGEAARAELEGRLAGLRRSVRSTTDPRDALALVAAAGAAVLLAQDAWPLVEDLRRRVADGGGSGSGSGPYDDADPDDADPDHADPDHADPDDAGPHDAGPGGATFGGLDPGGVDLGGFDPGGLDPGSLDLGGLDLGLDLGSIGDAVDAVDAGVDAGGGGGGDGGGGGGD